MLALQTVAIQKGFANELVCSSAVGSVPARFG